MKAVAVFPKGHEVKVIDVPEPRLEAPGQVRVRTLEVGVCGTDKEIVQGLHGRPPQGEDHLIVGHECLGEVVEVGAGVKDVKVGDLVVPRVRRPCSEASCAPCRQGHADFCVTGQYTERGIQGAHGFCAEFFVEDARYLHVLPRELRQVGVLTETLTIAEKALRQVALLRQRVPWKRDAPERAVVLGAGPVGLLGAMALVRAGYETTVYSHSRKPNKKAELAESWGVPYLSSEELEVKALVEQRGRADVVYEAAGAAGAAFTLVSGLAPNGVFVFTGVPESEKEKVDQGALMKQLVLNNQVLLGTVNAAAEDFEAAVRDLSLFRGTWPGGLEAIITARHPPEDYAEVVTGDKSSAVKDVIVFSRG
ncbi:glucose 1-dehydrogenase [Melittangium boletus]|uniref:Glucose 1-dehydrogenase n=1 Tax=Melittangium boletus DSM 14713 TaxID=1294270 RepID=A0A250IFJ8_9BACT|nr:glucose 1-dehydrogenase [Melittangium boletus]ATB29990.1 glucose 1-dehydrogenase [Melittangium boletus DSM 14713]